MVKSELLNQILALPAADREQIVDIILASLNDELPPQLSPKDQQELLRRADRFQTHPESFFTWEQVKEQLARQRADRSA